MEGKSSSNKVLLQLFVHHGQSNEILVRQAGSSMKCISIWLILLITAEN